MSGRNNLTLTKAATSTGLATRPDADFMASQFGPWAPIRPFPIDIGREPRFQQYLPGVNLPQTPGTGKLVPFDMLKMASKICTPLRRALEVRKQELSTQPWDIRIRERYQKKLKFEAIADKRDALINFFTYPNLYEKQSFGDWIREAEENVAVLDAFSVYFRRTMGPRAGTLNSGLAALDIIDGSTIKPIVNVRGGTPQPPAVAYQQYLYGAPRMDFMAPEVEEDLDNPVVMKLNAEQMYHRRFNRIPGSLYGLSNVETSLWFVKLWLGRIRYHSNYFDESSVPAGFMEMPPEWKQGSIDTFERDLNRVLSSDSSWRWRIKAIPGGAKFTQLKPPEYAMDFDDWLITQIASCMDVTAEELGVTPRHGLGGKGWAEAAGARQVRLSLQPRLTFYAEFFNYIIDKIFGIPELEFAFIDPEQTDQLEQAQADNLYVNNGTRTRNEVREDRGWDKSENPSADELFITTAHGITPVAAVDDIVDLELNPPTPPPPVIMGPGGAPPDGTDGGNKPEPPNPPKPGEPPSKKPDTPVEANKDVTVALGMQPYDLDGEGKVSKASVHYSDRSKDEYQCQNCVNWQGAGVCALVYGAIDPEGWCDRYSENSLGPEAPIVKAGLAELGKWERFAGRPWTRGRRFTPKAVAAELADSIQSALDNPPADVAPGVWRSALFSEAREQLRQAGNIAERTGPR
jgi:hypothetical protein